MKKYNNNSMYFKDWTTRKLKAEAKDLDYQIHEIQCYGTSDCKMLAGICFELENRGELK